MKRYMNIALLCSLLFVTGLLITGAPAAEAADGLDNFQRQNTLSPGTFSDASEGDWYYADLKNVYEYGLMLGKSASVFDPEGNITIAQTIAVAARIHRIYHTGTADFRQGQPWYQVYVDYASVSGIPTDWPDYNREATRAEYAQMIAAALPDEALEAINQIEDGAIPDVPLSAPWSREIYKLYRAGVLLGVDGEGTCLPDASIKRSHVAAILSRVVDRDARIRKDLTSGAVPPQPSEDTRDEGTRDMEKNPELSQTGGGRLEEGNTWQPEDPNAGHQQGTAVPGQETRPDPNMMGTVDGGQTQTSDTNGGRPQVPEAGGGQTAPEAAVTGPALVAETIEASPGDRSVSLTVCLKNNPGVTAIGLLVSFDERLTLQSAQVSREMGGQSVLSPAMSNPMKLIWVDGLKDMAEDGTFATLIFDVPEDAPAGTFPVVLKCLQDDTFNAGDRDVPFTVVNGGIVVK